MGISEAAATAVMSEALAAHGIAVPAEPAPVAAPAAAAVPATVEQQIEDANAPMRGASLSEQATIASAFHNPPPNPSYYDFKPGPGVKVDSALDSSVRALFQSEGIPLGTGNAIAKLWNDAAANPPNEAQLATQHATTMAELSRSGNAEETIALARSEVARLEARSPGIKAMLDASGLGNNLWLTRTLAARALARKQ